MKIERRREVARPRPSPTARPCHRPSVPGALPGAGGKDVMLRSFVAELRVATSKRPSPCDTNPVNRSDEVFDDAGDCPTGWAYAGHWLRVSRWGHVLQRDVLQRRPKNVKRSSILDVTPVPHRRQTAATLRQWPAKPRSLEIWGCRSTGGTCPASLPSMQLAASTS